MTRRRMTVTAAVGAALAAVIIGGTWAGVSTSQSPWNRMGGTHGQGMMGGAYGQGMMGGAYGQGMMGGAYGPGMMGGGPGQGMMGGAYGQGRMGGAYGLAGDGRRVESLAAARQRAAGFADRFGLRVGETMQFANGYYAELTTSSGRGATEVLVDPADGSVALEYGPAMMWNTRYGMHASGTAGTVRVSAAEARTTAQRWLDRQGAGLSAGDTDEFPGYYTVHTLRDGKPLGMMSVNAYTGAVWDHTWHGRFITMSEE